VSYLYKSLNRVIGKAIHDYAMIRDGDRILVALSGGADSLTLLWALSERRGRVPVRYDLAAAHLDVGYGGMGEDVLRGFCDPLHVPFTAETTDYGRVGHSAVNRENPCFLCGRLRRKRIFEIAAARGCNKVALGHNKDDLIETLFLNMCFAGEIATMRPAQPFFEDRFTVIRPLAYADGGSIRRFAAQQRFPVTENACPSSKQSRRSDVKQMLNDLYRSNPKIKGNIFHALSHVKADYLLK
jgi:tRNA 2-thiocytidine biosynthesis protein TtcA